VAHRWLCFMQRLWVLTMLSVTKREDGFSVFGHAEYADMGKDIVCSAMSFLAQSVSGELRKYVEITEHKEPGMMDVKLLTTSIESKVLLDYFADSSEVLAKMYPSHVKYTHLY
jgi:uncharacterized protein YsxB (DUF464 family)